VLPGDIVLEVAGERVFGLADLFRKLWRLGSAGVEVPLTLARKGTLTRVRVHSVDRNELLWKPKLH
jgi:S1-C subfamily serine protease